jgi:hypothetical protein
MKRSEELVAEIERRDNDKEWLNSESENDFGTNRYFWFHAGERDKMLGRLEKAREMEEQEI